MAQLIAIAVIGATGRMGRMIIRHILTHRDMTVVAALEANGHEALGEDVASLVQQPACGVMVSDDYDASFSQADVAIDFSNARALDDYLTYAVRHSCALVIGTTGIDERTHAKIKEASGKIGIVVAPNMSRGIYVLHQLVVRAAELLQEYDGEILELHHGKKKDAPSGTALSLGKLIKEVRQDKGGDFIDRMGERPRGGVGYGMLRGGEVVGDHSVFFIGAHDRLEITHRSSSRAIYVQGAVEAALWVAQQKAGLYDMRHVIEQN